MDTNEAIVKLDGEIKKMEKIISDGLDLQSKGLEGTAKTISQVRDSMAVAEKKIESLEAEKKSLEKRLSELEVKGKQPGYGTGEKPIMATPGQQFILSDQYQTSRDKKSAKVEAVEYKNLFERKQIAGATRGDLPPDRAPVWAQREQEIIFEPGQREMMLFDLMASAPCTSNAIEYFREVVDSTYPGADSQEEETHEKPQASINFEKETAVVQTIATWIPASRQVLDDAPQLQSYLDGRLTYAIMAEAEQQILFGTGATGQLLGIMNTPGIGTLNPTGTQTALDCLRLAIATVRSNEYRATAIILNPMDWAAIELLKGTDARYVWVQVPEGGEARLWRVPVVESTVMTEGQYLLGAFGLGAKIWDRQQATIRISEHHEDYFIRNAVAILAELRLALACYRPSAFVKGVISGSISS